MKKIEKYHILISINMDLIPSYTLEAENLFLTKKRESRNSTDYTDFIMAWKCNSTEVIKRIAVSIIYLLKDTMLPIAESYFKIVYSYYTNQNFFEKIKISYFKMIKKNIEDIINFFLANFTYYLPDINQVDFFIKDVFVNFMMNNFSKSLFDIDISCLIDFDGDNKGTFSWNIGETGEIFGNLFKQKIDRFMDPKDTQSYINFLESERFLQILNYTDRQLEEDHAFIQWIFPLDVPSAFNSNAPIINPYLLQDYPEVCQAILVSTEKMVSYWGFENKVVVDVEKLKLLRGHNGLRFSRMLQSLVYHGHDDLARVYLTEVLNYSKLISPSYQNGITIWELCYNNAFDKMHV